MQNRDAFRGIFTIPSTPFKDDGEIDISSFRRIVNFCIECGAHGLVYPVNASEFTSLSDRERFELTEVLIEENNGRLPVIVGVAGVAREVAQKFAAHANEIGAHGVIAMPPYIQSDLSQESIFHYYEAIAKAAQMPVFIQNYHGPSVGTSMSADFLVTLCREIEYVDYIKKEETTPSTRMHSEVITKDKGWCKGVFGGAGGRYLLEEYQRGTSGNMPGCHVTDIVVKMWNALEAGDEKEAEEIYKALAPLYFFESQLPGCYKEVLYRRGVIDCALRRNEPMFLDTIASDYLDEILIKLKPLMTWEGSEIKKGSR